MSAKSDSRLAEFLRRVLAGGNDAAPADVIFGQDPGNEVQRSIAQQFAASIHELGYIGPANGPDGDLHRVRVTPEGQEWLAAYDQQTPTLHPRYSS